MNNIQASGTRFRDSSEAGSGTASVTRAASSGRAYWVTDISGSSDQGSGTTIIKLFSDLSSGGTYWQDRVNVSYEKHFNQPLKVTTGSAVTLNVRNVLGVGSCWVNISGYLIG